MYFPAEHLLDKLQISDTQPRDFEKKGIVTESQKRNASSIRHGICTGSSGSCSS